MTKHSFLMRYAIAEQQSASVNLSSNDEVDVSRVKIYRQ